MFFSGCKELRNKSPFVYKHGSDHPQHCFVGAGGSSASFPNQKQNGLLFRRHRNEGRNKFKTQKQISGCLYTECRSEQIESHKHIPVKPMRARGWAEEHVSLRRPFGYFVKLFPIRLPPKVCDVTIGLETVCSDGFQSNMTRRSSLSLHIHVSQAFLQLLLQSLQR